MRIACTAILAAAAFLLATSLPHTQIHSGEKGSPVIFADDFESGHTGRWHQGESTPMGNRLKVTSKAANVHSGKYAVEFIASPGKGSGSKLCIWFMPGYDQVYGRWYIKFADDFDQGNLMHTGGGLSANRADDKYSAFGKAGICPSGDDFYCSRLEPWRDWGRNPPPGELMFYTYFPDMKIDRKMGKYYGNMFRPRQKFVVERGRWYCMEIMLKANTAGHADGEQAFWVDGKLIGHFKGIRWRTTDALKINCFVPMLYIHDNKQVNRVFYDDIVVSREYIGPAEG